MTRSELSRRRVLGGLATVGTLGALGGAGANAILRDVEGVRNDLVSGSLDLEVCVDDGDGCVPVDGQRVDLVVDLDDRDRGSVTVEVTLPATDGNNPGYVWFRTNCPDGRCGIEQATDATVRLDADCDGPAAPRKIARGSLCDVLNTLGGGRPLDGDPVQPGRTICLEIEWDLVDDLCEEDRTTVTLEFFAHQARHTGGPERPWTRRECDVRCKPDDECACDEGPAISFVAFCVPEGVVLEPSDLEFGWRDDGEGDPVKIRWQSDVALSTVVLYHGSRGGPVFENFPGGHSGTATVGAGGPARPGQRPSSPAPDGETGIKFEYENGRFVLEPDAGPLVRAVPPTPGASSTHALEFSVDPSLDGRELETIKIEYDGDFDLRNAAPTLTTADGVNATVSTVTAERTELELAFDAGTLLAAGTDLVIEYAPVTNTADAGQYAVEATVSAGGQTATVAGNAWIR